ncbi:MAG: RNA pseudouridine synthase [Candidatus Omnitrophica bacterium]|nr:RNA pseudouridine synthase [Candidatus Omnitrophota bacterium]
MNEKTIDVLHEDDILIVFDKPAGLLVIPSPKQEKNTLTSIVNRQYAEGENFQLHPCHRLDRETSGVIIYAKGKQHQQRMMQEFQKGAVEKRYTAFVRGHLQHSEGEIQKAIVDYHQRQFQRRVKPKSAVTEYRVISRKPDFSVVDVWPKTGRTNQIRIHFAHIGNPLLGERVYAFRKDFTVDFKRLALHASEIVFEHPVYHKKISVKSELPNDMKQFWKS